MCCRCDYTVVECHCSICIASSGEGDRGKHHSSVCLSRGHAAENIMEKSPCLFGKINNKNKVKSSSRAICVVPALKAMGLHDVVNAVDLNPNKQQCYKRNNSFVSMKSFHLCFGEDDIYGHHESSVHCSSTKHLQAATNGAIFISCSVDKYKQQEKCF